MSGTLEGRMSSACGNTWQEVGGAIFWPHQVAGVGGGTQRFRQEADLGVQLGQVPISGSKGSGHRCGYESRPAWKGLDLSSLLSGFIHAVVLPEMHLPLPPPTSFTTQRKCCLLQEAPPGARHCFVLAPATLHLGLFPSI